MIKRHWEIDALRGLMLVLMMLTHLPTRLTSPTGQPFGFVSAAEGFVLLSAYVAGMVYSRRGKKRGFVAMRMAFLRRALKIYWCHAGTLIFLFTVITAIGLQNDQSAVKDLISFYLIHPVAALLTGLLLIYTPPLLDILPMYVVFMLVTPWLLIHGMRRGWAGLMATSAGLWLLAQFGLGRWLYDATVALSGLPVPFEETGSFGIFSWQLLWMLGLWMGASRTETQVRPFVFPAWVVAAAVLLVIICMVWRHVLGQAPFGTHMQLNLLFDKWQLGPFRVLNLSALVVVVIRFGPTLASNMRRPRLLETLGAASLSVFCAHLVIVLLVLAIFGADPWQRPWWGDALLLGACFSLLYGVARVTVSPSHPTPPAAGSVPLAGGLFTTVAVGPPAPVEPLQPPVNEPR